MQKEISDIFNDFYCQMDSDNKKTFNTYFLGSDTSDPIKFSDYIKTLKFQLSNRTFGKFPVVTYTRMSEKTNVHEEISIGKIPSDWIDGVWISNKIYPDSKYPNITTKNYEYYTGIVFLLHHMISRDDVPFDDITKLASEWYDYSIKEILGFRYPKYIYRYANKHVIYESDVSLNTTALAQNRIYTNHIFGPRVLIYYEED